MKCKKIFLCWLISGILFLLSFALQTKCPAEEAIPFKPLFPVRLDHPFPESNKTFEEVKRLIIEHYYNDNINEEALNWAAIQGMLRYISPPQAPDLGQIWTAEEYAKILLSRQGQQVSPGFKSSFNPSAGVLTVTEILPNSPAVSILKPFDRILRIDGRILKDKTLDEIDSLLNGPEGTKIELTVARDVQILNLTLVRQKFATESLSVSRLTDSIALVEIISFTADISKQLGNDLSRLKKDGIRKLIIDLRNNHGGVFIESLRVAELFLPEKSILLRTYQPDTKLQNYISSNTDPFDFDIAILINHNTASSAEILTITLQDHQKALVIGTRSYGKGVFEKTFKLANEFRVKFITGAMYSPKGHSWQDKGAIPDFLIKQNDETLAILSKMEARERLHKDDAMITAYKLLMR